MSAPSESQRIAAALDIINGIEGAAISCAEFHLENALRERTRAVPSNRPFVAPSWPHGDGLAHQESEA